MIKIANLNVSVEEKEILKGINLEVKSGELHVIMGRNGTGKSTLANVLVGKDKYKVTNGTVNFNGENLLDMSPEDRACAGLFLSFQYPVAIPGVNNMYFLKAAVNAVRKSRGEEEIDAVDFLSMIREKLKMVALDESFIHRPVNEGFSGGEKKRSEVLQMTVLKPRVSILDEPDSGLDIDSVQAVAKAISNTFDKNTTTIMITHYARILNYLDKLDYVHVFAQGKILKTGDSSLAGELEKKGYDWVLEEKSE